MRSVVISSGHGKYISGATGYLNEHPEAVRVVDRVFELLQSAGVTVRKFHDDTSTTQNQNLETIVAYHNSKSRDLDVSIHFNSNATTSKPMGCECWYMTQDILAQQVATNMASALGLPNRGKKYSSGLYFLVHTTEPAILAEVCFVDSSADANAYKNSAKFEALCKGIAEAIGDVTIGDTPPITEPPPAGEVAVTGRPDIYEGSRGPLVEELQTCIGVTVDGLFGSATERAVMNYQNEKNLSADGIVGPKTWGELEQEFSLPPYKVESVISETEIEKILELASGSEIAHYSWKDRGQAPLGYIKGVALSYAEAYRRFQDEEALFEALAMPPGDSDTDAMKWYEDEFRAQGMRNASGGEILRHLYVLLMGLGMRESSGRHCEGRDTSASNVTSDTAEAGLYQTSWNARSGDPELMQALYDKYYADSTIGYLDEFSEDVSCSSTSWQCYGSGSGYMFQYMCKEQPQFAVETCAVTLRNLRQHYGPINRKEAEIKTQADELFKQIETLLED